MSLRARIATVAALAVAVAVIAVSAGAYVAARAELLGEVDSALMERATIVEEAASQFEQIIATNRRGVVPPGILGGFRGDFDVVYYQLTLPNDRVILPEGQPLLPEVPVSALGDGTALSNEVVDGVHVRMATIDAGALGVVQIARPLTEVDATLSGLAAILVAVGTIGTILAGAIGLLVAQSALKPIGDLTEAAEHVAETQDLGQRLDIESHDEVGSLAQSFNAMLAALDESRAQQRRLVRDAGHELRTPLTALRTNIEVLAKSEELTDELRKELIDAASAEVIDLSTLVTEIVDLASDRFAEGSIERVMLDDIAETSVEKARRRGDTKILLTTELSPVMGRPAALERAIDNLLDNAKKWNGDDEPIEVEVSEGRLTVRDHGPGIPAEDRALVFDRFYRSASARSTPGSGLGLSIVKQVAEDLGGTVIIDDAPDGGAVVGFRLPPVGA
jgi:two-component system, OmpR family, sensor histidine kinase MprB